MMVIALIGILTAVALPRYMDHRNRIRVDTAQKHIRIMSAAVSDFAQEYGRYPDDLSEVSLANTLDPWGRPFVYYNIDANGRGHARKDRALNPLNTDFDLYSIGADGKTKGQISNKDSLDDVIRARNGGFVDLADKF
jgi:general secretion pathway protein G